MNGRQKTNPLVVALTHRRVLEDESKGSHQEYRKVLANAAACKALLQLDPLPETSRYMYLCLALETEQVPIEVASYVSRVANGNPQHIEIMAEIISNHQPAILQTRTVNGKKVIEMTSNGPSILEALEPPEKITGSIRQTLGTIGAKAQLLVKVLSQFDELESSTPVEADDSAEVEERRASEVGNDRKNGRLPSMGPLAKAAAKVASAVAQRRERAKKRQNRGNTLPATEANIQKAYASITPIMIRELRDELARLVVSGIVIEVPPTKPGEPSQYALEHSLLKDIASSQLLETQRASILGAITRRTRTSSSSDTKRTTAV